MTSSASLSDAEMVSRARGVDFLPSREVQRLSSKAKGIVSWRLKSFFNTREGWLLRRVARGHTIVRTSRNYCGLCYHNIKGALRPMTNAKCGLCHTPLCTLPREGESGRCCFQEWHEKDELKQRIYLKRSGNSQRTSREQP